MRTSGRPSSSAIHSVDASSSGRANPVKGSPGPRPYSRPVVSPFMSDADKLAAVRAALPSLSAAIQLNAGSAGPLPAEVAAAMAELEAYEREFGRAQLEYWEESKQRMDEARAAAAAVLGGELDEVAITHVTTDGMNHGTWAAGAIPVNVRDLGVDMYSVPAQKWLLGPEGLGALWVRRELLDSLETTFASFFTFASLDSRGNRTLQTDARRFQVTNYHRPSILGMARAIGWLTMYVGLEFVHRRGAEMAHKAAAMLAEIDGVELLTPRDR